MTIELNNVTESHALEVLLRAMSGYIAAPRPVDVANLSRFDRIIVMPTLASARPAVAAAPPPVYQQQTPQYMQQPQPADDDADDEQAAPNVAVPQRGPVFNTFPQQPQFPGQAPPQFQPQTTISPFNGQPFPGNGSPNQAAPVAPPAPFGGVAVPGMVAPVPQPQPGQFPPGQQPPQVPPRRP